jgi:DNA-binding SARP family transcriptional activator
LSVKTTPFDQEIDGVFRCFGPTSLLAGGAAQPAGGHRERSLLAALLLQPGDHQPVGRLADALWPNGKPRDPGHALRTLVMRLRRRIAPIRLETTASGYRIVADVDQVDIHRFARFVNEGRNLVSDGNLELGSKRYSMALDLASSGEPWEDLTTSRVGQAASARMAEVRRRTEEDQAELMIRLGMPAVAYLSQLTTEEPLRERRWCLLMVALYQSGRQSEALRAYTEARSILQREIGVDPGPELREVERRVLAQEQMIIG